MKGNKMHYIEHSERGALIFAIFVIRSREKPSKSYWLKPSSPEDEGFKVLGRFKCSEQPRLRGSGERHSLTLRHS